MRRMDTSNPEDFPDPSDAIQPQFEATLRKMIDSPACERLWATIEKRSDPNAVPLFEIFREIIESGACDVPPTKKSLFEHIQDQNEQSIERANLKYTLDDETLTKDAICYYLVCVVLKSLRKQEFYSIASKSQRKEKLLRIKTLIQSLKEEVSQINSQDFPDGIRSSLEIHATKRIGVFLNDQEYIGTKLLDKNEIMLATWAARHVVSDYESLLDAVLDGTRQWAEGKAITAHPNSTNAHRLILIRNLTEFFRDVFNTPSRSCVLAVVSVFFDITDLDESVITKLAP